MRSDFQHQGSHLTHRHCEQHNVRTLHCIGSRRGDAVDDTELESRFKICPASPYTHHLAHRRSLFKRQRNRAADQANTEYCKFADVNRHDFSHSLDI